MKILFLALVATASCTYTVTDDARMSDLLSRTSMLEQKQAALESQARVQSEQLQTLQRRIVMGK